MNKAIEYLSNGVITVCATITTITADDLRLWVVALAGLCLTFFSSAHRRYKDRLEAQDKRQDVCAKCIARGRPPKTCVVWKPHRPDDCLMHR